MSLILLVVEIFIFFLMIRRAPRSTRTDTLFPYTTLFRSDLQQDLDGTHALAQQVVMLRHSRRFGEGSGIGQLARRVNRQQPEKARQLLVEGEFTDLFSLALKGEHDGRSEERRVGKECVSTCRSWWSPYH